MSGRKLWRGQWLDDVELVAVSLPGFGINKLACACGWWRQEDSWHWRQNAAAAKSLVWPGTYLGNYT